MRKPFTNTIVLVVLLTLAAGCGPAAPAAAPVSPTASPVPATPMPPTDTAIPPTTTPVPSTPVPTAPPGALTLGVPSVNPPRLDGTLSAGEWDSARREQLSDGSELLLMQNGGYLYLGIRAHIQGLSAWSVCLDRGDEIAVLHSSAALGTAVYKRTESGWQRTRTFAWTLRDTSNSETAQQGRKQFLEEEGWLASLGTMGKPEEVEFQLAMPQSMLRLAVAFLLPPGFDKAALWPAGLDDDARNLDLLRGDAPAQARFSPERWAVVTVDGYETAGPVPTPGSEATPIPPGGSGAGLIAFYSDRDGNPEIYVMDSDGSDQRRLTFSQFEDSSPDWSPDGSQIAFISDRDDPQAGNCFPDCAYQIYVIQTDGSGEHKLVDTESRTLHPDWHPDGTRLSYDTELNLEGDVYVVNADGSGLQRLIHDGFWADWSPDGTQLVFASKRDGNVEIYVADADGGNQRRLTDNSQLDYFPAWSPDGRRIAFARLERKQVFVMNADGSDEQQLTHQSNAENPSWSPDGAHIVFQSSGEGNFDIYTLHVEGALEGSGGSAPRRLTENRAAELWPSWGPAPGSGLYLGQTPPGLDVAVFAPGIVSVEEGKEYNITISPDLQEIFFTRRMPGGRDDRIWTSRLENGNLTVPELAPFAYDLLETDACFTPDGNRLYFNSARPLPGEETASPLPNVWFVDRTETGWSEPQFVGPPLNDYHPVYLSIANDGTLYFTRSSPRGIYYAEPELGRYLEARRLPDEINGVRDVAHPAVAPDESYLVVDSSYEQGGRLTGSLYISFRKPDGSWTTALSMHDALQASEADVYALPRITPDGKYLFFERYEAETDRSDIYWVSTAVVEPLRPHIPQETGQAEPAPTAPSTDGEGLRITILYDNYLHDERLTSEWGFSALVEVDDRVLLFDTGGSAAMVDNMRLLGIDPRTIQAVVLSHEHGDHTDGLLPFLAQADRPPVYLLRSFPARFKNAVAALTSVVEVTDSLEIFPGIYTTGQVTGDVSEQALAIRTDQGSVIITGCAHPGIARMVEQGRSTLQLADAVQDAPVALVVGGFHLGGASRAQIERVIADLLSLNVQQVCPTHCTGDVAIAMFAEAFGEGFIPGGAGKIITLP